nr:uncharacterized protein LOC113810213 [Penaeus vannamei]XP_027217724.1 uncharacterized protein LOC113810213 [Penaeus vannamei]XP_027217725.1 uncharacterized protein LOC113810213 [Penaeus vannamei]
MATPAYVTRPRQVERQDSWPGKQTAHLRGLPEESLIFDATHHHKKPRDIKRGSASPPSPAAPAGGPGFFARTGRRRGNGSGSQPPLMPRSRRERGVFPSTLVASTIDIVNKQIVIN